MARNIGKDYNELFRKVFEAVMKDDDNSYQEASFYQKIASDSVMYKDPALYRKWNDEARNLNWKESAKFWKPKMPFDINGVLSKKEAEKCIDALAFELFQDSSWEPSWENVSVCCDETNDYDAEKEYANSDGLIGIHELPTGEVFFGFCHGGDEEYVMVNAILYLEDGELKWYAPEKGNAFNVKEMCAFSCYDKENDEYDVDALQEYPYDAEAELADVTDFFHNRKDGQHAEGIADENPWWEIDKKYLCKDDDEDE